MGGLRELVVSFVVPVPFAVSIDSAAEVSPFSRRQLLALVDAWTEPAPRVRPKNHNRRSRKRR